MKRGHFVTLWLLAITVAAAIGTHGIAYWDAGDYVRLSCDGDPSGLLLGRPAFLAASRALAIGGVRLGLSSGDLEPLLRWSWSIVAGLAAPFLALVGIGAGLPTTTALVAGMCLALSPAFAHASHQVLTDAPALAFALLALVVAQRSKNAMHALLSGVLLGVALGMRETAVVVGASVVWVLGLRRGALAVAATLATISLLVISAHDAHHPTSALLSGWMSAMGRSSSKHPLGASELLRSIGWLAAIGPVPLLFALRQALTATRGLMPIVLPSALACLLLLFYPDGSFSPRYFLAAAPLAVFLLGAEGVRSMRGSFAALALLSPLVAAFVAVRPIDARVGVERARAAAVDVALPVAYVVPGHACPTYGARFAADALVARMKNAPAPHRPLLLCPGWEWPIDDAALSARLDPICRWGTIVADVTPEAWVGPREQPARAAMIEWLSRRAVHPQGVFMRACP